MLRELQPAGVLCQDRAVAEFDGPKIPKAVRPVGGGAAGHR
jgi:hypothetical protein